MQAIRLILDKRMDWREREISEKMFSESLDNWQGHIIIISLRFAELDIEKEEEAVLKYISGNKDNEGSLTWFCIPDTETRKSLAECKNVIDLNDKRKDLTINDYISVLTCGAYVDFLDDKIYESIDRKSIV